MNPWIRAVVGVGLLGGLAAGVTIMANGASAGPDSPEQAKRDAPITVSTVAVRVGPLANHIDATTNLLARDRVEVAAEASGRVTTLAVDEGDVVQAGDRVASLASRDASLAVSRARIELRNAEQVLDRVKRLAGKGVIGDEELERARNDRDLRAHAVKEARATRDKTRVIAPFSGRVTRRLVVPGQHVQPGVGLVELTSFDDLRAELHIAERDAIALQQGRSVDFALQAYEAVKFVGTVSRIDDTVDVASGTVRVTVRVAEPPDQVRSGSFVTARIERERRPAARWLPREAVLRGGAGSYVFVVEDGIAHRRAVGTGIEEGGRLEIVDGIEEGARVVLRGHGALSDGVKVRDRANDAAATTDDDALAVADPAQG
jgi:RND family efflux transporter MFP subunit